MDFGDLSIVDGDIFGVDTTCDWDPGRACMRCALWVGGWGFAVGNKLWVCLWMFHK